MLFNWLLFLFIKRHSDLFTLNFEMAEFKSHISLFESIDLVLKSVSGVFGK